MIMRVLPALSRREDLCPRRLTSAKMLKGNQRSNVLLNEMRLLGTVILAIGAFGHLDNCAAEFRAAVHAEPAQVFGGREARIPVTIENPEPVSFESEIRLQLFQLSSSTAAPVSQLLWKTIRLLPRQTACETVLVIFPEVSSEASFLIEWIDKKNRILGRAPVAVFPTNLLAEIKSISSGKPVELFDPENQMKPILALNGVPCSNLEEKGIETAIGPLVIVAPFTTQSPGRKDLGSRIQALSKRGIAVLWIRLPIESRDKLVPSFYVVTNQRGAVVVAQPELVANLGESPRAQSNLIHLARMAVHPESLQIPELGTNSTDPK